MHDRRLQNRSGLTAKHNFTLIMTIAIYSEDVDLGICLLEINMAS